MCHEHLSSSSASAPSARLPISLVRSTYSHLRFHLPQPHLAGNFFYFRTSENEIRNIIMHPSPTHLCRSDDNTSGHSIRWPWPFLSVLPNNFSHFIKTTPSVPLSSVTVHSSGTCLLIVATCHMPLSIHPCGYCHRNSMHREWTNPCCCHRDNGINYFVAQVATHGYQLNLIFLPFGSHFICSSTHDEFSTRWDTVGYISPSLSRCVN